LAGDRGASAPVRPTVETEAGLLAGVRTGACLEFLGIPYARAERFAPPTLPPSWSGTREATRYGPAAPQPDRTVATFTHGPLPPTDEQCLYLNVYTPSLEGDRPVMAWLHGGGFAIGHAGASLYHGASLAVAADAVVVTVNYRLGSLGWLSHPSLAEGPDAPAGNWGLLDQIAALEWVRENVCAFGGDPDRVSVAGQSAGALCAIDLLATPAAHGLFARAILESPPLGDVFQAPEAARRWAEALAGLAGGVFEPGLVRSLAAERIVALHEQLLELPEFRGTRGGALPTLDAGSLPDSPLASPGVAPDVDVLVGHNADEGTFFFNAPWRPAPPPARAPEIVAHLCPDEEPDDVLRRYGGDLVAIATEAIVAGPAARWARARVAGGGCVYRYRVDHPGAGPQLRATHTVEVPLLFGTWSDGGPGERLGGQGIGTTAVAQELVRAWGSFLHGHGPGWRPIDANDAEVETGVFGGRRAHHVESGPHA
jgi:para-nitrobenzyl esterase